MRIISGAELRAVLAPVVAEALKDTLTPFKECLCDRLRDGPLTLSAVARLPGATGNKALVVTGTNVVLFGGLSWDAISAITELQIDGLARLVPTSPLVYALEGIAPELPLAAPGRSYAKDHWLPVVLVAGERPAASVRDSHTVPS